MCLCISRRLCRPCWWPYPAVFFHVSPLSKVNPRYLTSLDNWIVLLKRNSVFSPFVFLFLVNYIITVLFGLIDKFVLSHHFELCTGLFVRPLTQCEGISRWFGLLCHQHILLYSNHYCWAPRWDHPRPGSTVEDLYIPVLTPWTHSSEATLEFVENATLVFLCCVYKSIVRKQSKVCSRYRGGIINDLVKSKSKSLCNWQSVCLSWCRAQTGAHDQMFFLVWKLLSCACGAPSLATGRVCHLSVIVDSIVLVIVSKHLQVHNYVLLYTIYTRLLSDQAQYSKLCPISGSIS
jgi:hypothetical protein